jgi:hypothetical protein
MSGRDQSGDRVRLPSNTELADKIAFGLTGRQLTILGATALAAYGLFTLSRTFVPAPFAVAPAVPVVAAGVLLALGRRHGLPADLYALAAARFLTRPRLRLLAPEGLPTPLPGTPPKPAASPLELPVRAVYDSGLVALTDGGFCRLLRASATGFALRSDEEQQALLEAFGRFLNGLADPIQIAVHSQPVDLDGWAAKLEHSLPTDANPQLKAAGAAHAQFVAGLGSNAEVRQREIVLVLTARTRERAAAQAELERRASETVDQLQAAGVELQPLSGQEAAELLAHTLDPPGPPIGSSLSGVVRGC